MVFSHLYFFFKDSVQIPACSKDPFLHQHLVGHDYVRAAGSVFQLPD